MTFEFNYTKTKTLYICILAFSASILNATTYYVSPSGNSATGTFTSPMSFTTAMSKSLVVGDSVILRGGTYSFNASQTISKSGSTLNFIHVVAYKDEVPVFDFRTQPYSSSNIGVKVSGNYLHIKGLTIQGAGDNGMQVTGNNNCIEYCTFRWNCDSGLQLKTGSNNLIKNCDSYENFDYQTGGTASPDYGGNADGFADKQYTSTGTNTIKGCRSWRNSDDGWDHFEKIGNTVYDSCWCYANGPASFDMTDHIRYTTDKTWIDAVATTSLGRKYIKNYGNGNGFKLGGNYTAHNATLHRCISVQNTVKGFDQNNNNGTMTIYNCTGYQNKPDYGFSNSSYGSLVIKNCATLSSKSSNSLSTKSVSQSFNSWNSGFSCTTGDFENLDVTQLLNTRQADGSLPEITLLHQKNTSGMIDKGTDVGIPYSGLAPDLGAFEFNQTTATNDFTDNQLPFYFSESTKEITIKDDFRNISVYNLCGQKMNVKIESNKIRLSELLKGIFVVTVTSTDNLKYSSKIAVR